MLYPKRRADMVRWVVGVGIGYGLLSSPYNYVKQRGSGFFSFTNWTNDVRDNNQAMLLLNANLNFTPDRMFGIAAGPYALISEGYSGGGISVGILLGKVGNHVHIRNQAKSARFRERRQKRMFWKK